MTSLTFVKFWRTLVVTVNDSGNSCRSVFQIQIQNCTFAVFFMEVKQNVLLLYVLQVFLHDFIGVGVGVKYILKLWVQAI